MYIGRDVKENISLKHGFQATKFRRFKKQNKTKSVCVYAHAYGYVLTSVLALTEDQAQVDGRAWWKPILFSYDGKM